MIVDELLGALRGATVEGEVRVVDAYLPGWQIETVVECVDLVSGAQWVEVRIARGD